MKSKPRVVVLGGGFSGLESAFYLVHRLGDRADVTLVSDRDHFVFKPNTIYIPFDDDPGKYVVPLRGPTAKKRIRFVNDPVTGIDPEGRKALLEDGELVFDYLVVATGAGMRPVEIPGLKEHAVTVWEPEEMLRLRRALRWMVGQANGGDRLDLLFLVPPNNRCSGPLYEMCLMSDTWLLARGRRNPSGSPGPPARRASRPRPRLDTVVKTEFEERGRGLPWLGRRAWSRDRPLPERREPALRPARVLPALRRARSLPFASVRRPGVHPRGA
jgi:hypothetical protein